MTQEFINDSDVPQEFIEQAGGAQAFIEHARAHFENITAVMQTEGLDIAGATMLLFLQSVRRTEQADKEMSAEEIAASAPCTNRICSRGHAVVSDSLRRGERATIMNKKMPRRESVRHFERANQTQV